MSAEQNPATNPESGAEQHRTRAVLLVTRNDIESQYSMFESVRISPTGAFLASSMFLELGEEIHLALSCGGRELRTDARIVGLDAGSVPGMKVEFSGLQTSDREVIADWIEKGLAA